MKVIGFDSTEAIINFLNAGVIQGFVVQDAFQIGYQGIKTLNAALSGQTVPKEIDIPVKFVSAQNINTPEIDKLLHPFGKSKAVGARPAPPFMRNARRLTLKRLMR